jgi:hypothetical protein
MKAKHYIKNYGAESCLEVYSNKFMFPEIDETQQWCNAETRFDTLLGLQLNAQFINAVSTSFLMLIGLAV